MTAFVNEPLCAGYIAKFKYAHQFTAKPLHIFLKSALNKCVHPSAKLQSFKEWLVETKTYSFHLQLPPITLKDILFP